MQLLLYVVYYCIMNPVGGAIFSVFLVLMYMASCSVVRSEQAKSGAKQAPEAAPGRAGRIALAVHILSWYMQLHPGHAVFERVKPALLTSLVQAITVAPFFAFYEGIWFLGLEQGLQKEVVTLVNATRSNMCLGDPSYAFCS